MSSIPFLISIDSYFNRLYHIKDIATPNQTSIFTRAVNKHCLDVVEKLTPILELATQLENVDVKSDSWNPQAIADLENFFKDTWAFIQGKMLCYTAMTHHPLTNLLCDLAKEVVAFKNHSHKDAVDPISIISVMMPTVNTESCHNSYSTLAPQDKCAYGHWQHIDILSILKTHVLGAEGKYLVPVNSINTIFINGVAGFPKIPNAYFDYQQHREEMGYINDEEMSRVYQHSNITRAIYDEKLHYDKLVSDADNLLGQLNVLIMQLAINSVNGLGTEEVAGVGGNLAIGRFLAWYELISAEDRKKIPQILLIEIDKLERCYNFVDKDGQPRIEHIETCLATRRSEAQSAISGFEALLMTIGLSKEQKLKQLQLSQQKIKQLLNELKFKVANQEYIGQDRLSLTLEMIEQLGIIINFSDFDELLDLLKELSANEIKDFCGNDRIYQEIISTIKNADQFTVLMITLSCEQLEVLFEFTLSDLLQNKVLTPNNLAHAFTILPFDKFEWLLEQHQTDIFDLVSNGEDYDNLTALSGPKKSAYIFTLFKQQARFDDLIQSTTDVYDVLLHLTQAQRDDIYTIVCQKFASIFTTGEQLWSICYFRPQQHHQIIERFMHQQKLPINGIRDLIGTFIPASNEQRRFILNKVDANIIVSGDEAHQLIHCILNTHQPSPIEKIILSHAKNMYFNVARKCKAIAIAILDLQINQRTLASAIIDKTSELYQALNTKGLCSYTLFGSQNILSSESRVLQELNTQMNHSIVMLN